MHSGTLAGDAGSISNRHVRRQGEGGGTEQALARRIERPDSPGQSLGLWNTRCKGAAMLVQFLMAPGATLMTLPRTAALGSLGLSGLIAGAAIGGSGVQAGKIGPAEICTLCIAGSLAFAAVALQIFLNFGRRTEDNFDMLPWRSLEQQAYECPYTGARSRKADTVGQVAWPETETAFCLAGLSPGHRCPVCDANVHETAFHTQDKLTTFVVGESVLDWPKAYKAIEQVQALCTCAASTCHGLRE